MSNNNKNETNENTNSNNNSMAFITGAVLGAFLGAVAGLLLSPASGEENRKQLTKAAKRSRDVAEDLYEEATEKYEDFKETADDYIHEVERRSRPIKKQASRMAVRALDNAEETIKDTRKKFFKGVRL